jgi:hypothetical protein
MLLSIQGAAMHRLIVKFSEAERSALVALAHVERRTIQRQIERLVREALELRGMITKTPPNALNLAEDAIDGAELNPNECNQ